jgi:hypothetical protein
VPRRRWQVAATLTASCREGDGDLPRAIAHIRFLFSGLVDSAQLSFLGVRPIR